MMQKILTLTMQLDEVRRESEKYKRIWDKVKAGIKRGGGGAAAIEHQNKY